MILTTEEIKDYQQCPMLYYYNHVAKAKPSKNSTIEKFALHSLNHTFLWFFNERMDGNAPSLKALRDKFGKIYIYDRSYAETMFLDARSKARVLENRCVKAISNFYNTFSIDQGVPLLVNKPYELCFDDIRVKGTIPVIRETQFKDIQLISFTSDILIGNKRDSDCRIEVERDIDIIASSIAFKRIYDWEVDIHSAYGLHYNNYYTCSVNGALMHNLSKIVKQVGKAIDQEIFYPVYNNKCTTCIYRSTCLKEW